MTPFGRDDIFTAVDTIREIRARIPMLGQEWERRGFRSLRWWSSSLGSA